MQTRVLDDVDPGQLPENQPFDAKTVCDPLGIPVLTPGAPISSPFEMLCGARSMSKFIHDLFTIPDKVEAVIAEEHLIADEERGRSECTALDRFVGIRSQFVLDGIRRDLLQYLFR